jgi:hypothetical protein
MKTLIKILLILGCCYQVSACTSLFVSTTPEKMYEGQDKNPEEISIIAGQNYRIKSTYWRQILIEKVDDKNVYSELFDLKFPHVVSVLPGKHEIQLEIFIGNQNNYKTPTLTPLFIVSVLPGRAYQICHTYERDENLNIVGGYSLTQQTYYDFSKPLPPSIQYKINESMTNVENIPNFTFIYIKDVGSVRDYLDYLETENAKEGAPHKKCQIHQ